MTGALPGDELAVIVVDDDFLVVKVHTRFVELVPGCRVVATASTGAGAIAAVHEHEPDLVLLDVHLPDRSGIDVLRTLRAEGNEVAVLMVTAAREVDQVRAARSGGATGYLVKPFSQPDLAARIEEVRAALRHLARVDEAAQEDIDLVFGSGPVASGVPKQLPKGLNAGTGELVLAAVRDAGEVSAAACAEVVGLSRVTARRYLEHLVATGRLEARSQYGKVGRPERLYRPR